MVDDTLRDNPAVAVCWHLARCFSLVNRDSDRVLARFGLTGPQIGVLHCLHEAGGLLPLSQIGDRLLVTCANITGVVDRLERDGLVVRERIPEDRRVVLARMTDEGRRTFEEARVAMVAHWTGLLDFMKPAENRQLADLLEQMHLHLKEIV